MATKEHATCETCNKSFTFYRSTLRGKTGRFCSRKCIKLIPHNKGVFTKRKKGSCLTCSKVFYYYKTEQPGKYCSQECVPNHPEFLKPMRGAKNPAWKGGKNKCIDCGKLLSNRLVKRCRQHAFMALRGENSPSWKGGISSLNRLQRVKFRRQMQKQIFERDNYTCQMCDSSGVDLQVDHIQPWAEYVELRFNMDNCRTLCSKCHYEITFGRPMPENIKGWGHNLLRRDDL